MWEQNWDPLGEQEMNALNSPVPFGQCFITVAGKHLNLIHELIPAGGYGHDS